jgi:hypothetical protein
MKNKVLKPLLYLMTIALPFFVAGQTYAQNVAWDYTDIVYGTDDPARQFLNIYLADTVDPAPVYFFAHSNGGTAYSVTQDQADIVHAQGYTLVSWESIPYLSAPEEVLTAWSDAQLAFDWIRANAATYNIDPDRIVIAGRSRGSVASWPLAHSGHPAIPGVYMYNALPNSVWVFPEIWTPPDDVNADSPPIYMVYGPTPGDADNHAPENAYPIRDAYTSFSIDDTFTTYDSMHANGFSNINHYFPEFVASLAPPPASANMTDNFDGGNTTYPWTEDGTWYISGGTYSQDDTSGIASASAGNPDWTDYTFQADMLTVSSANTSIASWVNSLMFRVTDDQNLYFLKLNASGQLQLRSILGGNITLVASVQTSYSPFTWLTYKIVLAGESIQASINDELLIDTSDSDHASGIIGVFSNRSSTSIDKVTVTQPPGC